MIRSRGDVWSEEVWGVGGKGVGCWRVGRSPCLIREFYPLGVLVEFREIQSRQTSQAIDSIERI